jgi:nitrogen fixation protein FixH
MAQPHLSPPISSGRFPNRWALFPVGLLGILVSVQVVLFSLSRNDPSFAVEPEYYQKAVSWDKHAEQRAANTHLGWRPSAAILPAGGLTGGAATLQVTLLDRDYEPVTNASLTATAFANARANDVQTLSLQPTEAGTYVGPLRVGFPGEWEIRLTATRDGTTFTHSSRVSVAASR